MIHSSRFPIRELIEQAQSVYAERLDSGGSDHFSRIGFALRFQDMAAVRALRARAEPSGAAG